MDFWIAIAHMRGTGQGQFEPMWPIYKYIYVYIYVCVCVTVVTRMSVNETAEFQKFLFV